MKQQHIVIKEDTKEMLNQLGKFRESYDAVIKRLIKENQEKECSE